MQGEGWKEVQAACSNHTCQQTCSGNMTDMQHSTIISPVARQQVRHAIVGPHPTANQPAAYCIDELISTTSCNTHCCVQTRHH
jgi:hypothetical protein